MNSGFSRKNWKLASSTRSTWAHPSIGTRAVSSTRRNQSASDDSNTSRYNASLDGKWYSRLGRRIPTSAAMSLSDVPS